MTSIPENGPMPPTRYRPPTEYDMKDSGQRQSFDTGAVRDTQDGKGRFDLLPPIALRRVAKVFEKGAKKYDARNWEKGIPVSRFMDSALRHIADYMEGKRDEDHLGQATFNLLAAIHTEEMIERGLLPEVLANTPDYTDSSPRDIRTMAGCKKPDSCGCLVPPNVEAKDFRCTVDQEMLEMQGRKCAAVASPDNTVTESALHVETCDKCQPGGSCVGPPPYGDCPWFPTSVVDPKQDAAMDPRRMYGSRPCIRCSYCRGDHRSIDCPNVTRDG